MAAVLEMASSSELLCVRVFRGSIYRFKVHRGTLTLLHLQIQ